MSFCSRFFRLLVFLFYNRLVLLMIDHFRHFLRARADLEQLQNYTHLCKLSLCELLDPADRPLSASIIRARGGVVVVLVVFFLL